MQDNDIEQHWEYNSYSFYNPPFNAAFRECPRDGSDCYQCGEVCMKMAPPTAKSKQVGGDHYRAMAIQPVEFIHANAIPFIEGCIIKYVCRHRAKNGLQDLEKARHFLDLLIEMEYSQAQQPAPEFRIV